MTDSNKTDDPVVDESTEQPEAPEQTVELDRPTEIEGDLVVNPMLEEEDAETTEGDTDDVEAPAETESDSEEDSETEPQQTDQEDLEPEPDDTGVYGPPTAQDPGDAFQPKVDYSFSITTTDGKTIKISSPEEADAFAKRLDEEDALVTAYQFTQFQRGFLKMENGLDRERAEYESQKELYDQQQAQIQVRDQMVTQWNNEVNYLRAKGMLPEITPEQNASNWTDPQNAEVPAIKETLAVFKWMETENNARRQAGIAEVTSAVDAYRMMKAEQGETTAAQERTQERATRQAKGAMVRGNSSFTPSNEQSNSIIGEGGSLQDLVREFSSNQ